jgi:hypothetical protein
MQRATENAPNPPIQAPTYTELFGEDASDEDDEEEDHGREQCGTDGK